MSGSATSITIPAQFNGPPASGNGGYVAGVVAGLLGEEAEVTLRRPMPLDRPLAVVADGDGLRVLDGETLVVEARRQPFDLVVPVRLTAAEAAEAVARRPAPPPPMFDRCFVCGPARAEGDGLRVLMARLPKQCIVAATWTPHARFADDEGLVRPEFVWSALDCPGGIASSPAGRGTNALLGRFSVRVLRPVAASVPYAVIGWALSQEGRRRLAGTALCDERGEVCAVGLATWVTLQPASTDG